VVRRAVTTTIFAGAFFAALMPAGAFAKTIDVHRGDSLRHAVAQAHNGDVVRIHPGTYRTHITIRKRLTLVGVGRSRPVIDAGCQANDTILVLSPGVSVSGLRVQGADVVSAQEQYPAEVYFVGVRSGKATNLRTIDTCDAEYGISAFSTGPVKVTNNFGKGFEDSAIYIGTILDTLGGTLLVAGNTAVHNSRGVIVEDSPEQTDITVRDNVLSNNTIVGSEGPSDGLFLHNSDGVLIKDNVADDNGASGFHADSNSDSNLFMGNSATGNGEDPFTDDNGGNCGSGNSFPISLTC
jgi:parallel beta-helix repeat protein